MVTATIQALQIEVAEVLARIENTRDWIQATEALREMIEVTPDESDHDLAYATWIGIYSNLYPAR